VKIAPPLTITREAIEEGVAVLSEATDEAVTAMKEPAKQNGGKWVANSVLG